MAYEIIETPLAKLDQREIIEYLLFSLGSPAAAASFSDEVE